MMETPSDICFSIDFSGLPKVGFRKLNITSNELIDYSVDLRETTFHSDDLLLTLAKMPKCSITFPKAFCYQNSDDHYQRNVEGFLKVLELCLLNQSGLNINERSNNTPQDDYFDLSAAPHGSDDTKR